MRNPIPGYRFFSCYECGNYWKEKTRDCLSPSGESCSVCREWCSADCYEQHPEWETDISGNLLNP